MINKALNKDGDMLIEETESVLLSYQYSSKQHSALCDGNSTITEKDGSAPCWLQTKCNINEFKNYDAFWIYNLRTKYLELEGDFRSINYTFQTVKEVDIFSVKKRIDELLTTARKALEGKAVNLCYIAHVLDHVEHSMIYITPNEIMVQKAESLANKILSERPMCSSLLCNIINMGVDKSNESLLRSAYIQISEEINSENITNHINYGLQVARLTMLLKRGISVIIAIILLAPISMNSDNPALVINNKLPAILKNILDENKIIISWLVMLALAGIGSIGGFVSGLLQIRSSKADLQRYEESVQNFYLKLSLGSITASLLCLLLTWNILPGIEVKSWGTLILFAFLSGFSERFFLKLLNVKKYKDPVEANVLKRFMHDSHAQHG